MKTLIKLLAVLLVSVAVQAEVTIRNANEKNQPEESTDKPTSSVNKEEESAVDKAKDKQIITKDKGVITIKGEGDVTVGPGAVIKGNILNDTKVDSKSNFQLGVHSKSNMGSVEIQ